MKIIILIFLLLQSFAPAQLKDPDKIIDNVISRFNSVRDYQVDITIKVDIEFLKVPESKAVIFFKQPDKVHIESDGFALIPKDGLDFSPSYLAKKDYTAIYEQDVMLDGNKTSIIKVIPTGDKGNVILSSLWIDQRKNIIRKVETTTKTNGTFSMNFYFDGNYEHPLPRKIIFSFNMDQMNLPKVFQNGTEKGESKKNKRRVNSTTKGQVEVTYSGYKVNKGIPDSIFEKSDRIHKNPEID